MRVPIGTVEVFQNRRFPDDPTPRAIPAFNRPVGTALSLFIILAILARLLSSSPSGTQRFHASLSQRLWVKTRAEALGYFRTNFRGRGQPARHSPGNRLDTPRASQRATAGLPAIVLVIDCTHQEYLKRRRREDEKIHQSPITFFIPQITVDFLIASRSRSVILHRWYRLLEICL
jgi:hypothetical protein